MKFSYEMFQNIYQKDPKKAFAYRDSMKSTKIDPIQSQTESEVVTQAETKENASEDMEIVDFSREDLEKLLNDAELKFMPNSKDETLLKKCIENNLI